MWRRESPDTGTRSAPASCSDVPAAASCSDAGAATRPDCFSATAASAAVA